MSIYLYQTEAYHIGSITNISLAGCFFPFEGDLPVGEQCDIDITVGEGLEAESVSVGGKIVRVDAEGAGISFTDYSPETRTQLEKIIACGKKGRKR